MSTSGDIAVALNCSEGENEYSKLMVFNSDGKIMWEKYHEGHSFYPQLSDNGKVIAVESGAVLMGYSKWGRGILFYNSKEGTGFSTINHYRLSRDGRYVVLATTSEKEILLSSWHYKLILLKDGNVEWKKSSIWKEFHKVSISSNNAYVAVSSRFGKPGNWYSQVALYTINGKKLWSTDVKGYTSEISASSRGEVLLSTDECILIRDGRVLWTKDDCINASFTRNEDKIIAIRKKGLDFSDWDVNLFNRDGKLLWEYQGAYRYDVSDNYHVLAGGEPGNEEVVLVSAEGVVLQRIKLRELIEKEVEAGNIYVSISPDGRYFAIEVVNYTDGTCYIYYFENAGIQHFKTKIFK